MLNLKKLLRKKGNDRNSKYWDKAASGSDELAMDKICTGFSKKDFTEQTKPTFFHNNEILESHMTVLDLACGMGRTCSYVAPKVKKYIGVDFSLNMIKKARKHNSKISNAMFEWIDGKIIGCCDHDMFDIVYCELAFQHMDKLTQKSIVNDVLRVLKKGGKFFVQIPRYDYFKNDAYALTDVETFDLISSFKCNNVVSTKEYHNVECEKK